MTVPSAQNATQIFDVAVIGGGAAGLSAAVVLGRARRSVVVVDAGSPRNAPATGVHGFLTRDGIGPTELIDAGRKEVDHYGGVFVAAEAHTARRTDEGFEVLLDDDVHVRARRLLVTTGLVDELPDVDGLRDRWGRDVLHCPYCHGWEFSGEPIGVLGTSERAVHQALLFRQWSSDVVLFTHTAPEPDAEQAEQLAARGVRVVTGTVDSLVVDDDRLTGVRLTDGTVVPRRALAVMPRMVARSALLDGLGIRPTTHPMGVGEFIAADPTGRTEVPGVWVAGNVTDLMAQVVVAAAGGVNAAAAVNADLIEADVRHAVEQHRRRTRPGQHGQHGQHGHGQHGHGLHGHAADPAVLFTKEFWDERYRSSERVWSGRPNPHLVTVAADLPPGTAWDVGSGEGADAVWLATRGWRVTATDVSTVALEKAAAHAAEAGDDIAGRITWQQADLRDDDPTPQQFDLVSAQFIHLPPTALAALHRRLAAAVRPGGTLLIVGHHPSDLRTTMGRPDRADLMFTAEQVAARLDPADWDIETSTPEREAADPDGNPVTIHDAVVRAVRR